MAKASWTERANAVTELLRKIPPATVQKNRDFYEAVNKLCEDLKTADAGNADQYMNPGSSLMGD